MKAKGYTPPKKKDKSLGIKLRLDSRTVVTLKNKKQLKNWQEMYPNAVVENPEVLK